MTARAGLLPLLGLALLAAPVQAQTHSSGRVTVQPDTNLIDIERGVDYHHSARVVGTIDCLVPREPDPVLLSAWPKSRTVFEREQGYEMWRMEPSTWELGWVQGALPGQYRFDQQLSFVVKAGPEWPAGNHADYIHWKGAVVKGGEGQCNVSYGWVPAGPHVRIQSHVEQEELILPIQAEAPPPGPMSVPPRLEPRSGLPVQARVTMGGAVAVTFVGLAALATARWGR